MRNGVALDGPVNERRRKRGSEMTGQDGRAELIGRQLRDSLRDKTRGCRIVKIAKHANVYTCGEIASSSIYVIESGQVKLLNAVARRQGVYRRNPYHGRCFRRVVPHRQRRTKGNGDGYGRDRVASDSLLSVL